MKLKLLSLVLIVIFTQDIKQLVAAAPSTFIPVAEPVAKAKAAAAAKAKADKAKADKAKAAAAPAKADKAKAKAAPAEALDCRKWWGNYKGQLSRNPMRTMAINCSQYIKDCGSYDSCVRRRPLDKNGCECFYNQKQSSESF